MLSGLTQLEQIGDYNWDQLKIYLTAVHTVLTMGGMRNIGRRWLARPCWPAVPDSACAAAACLPLSRGCSLAFAFYSVSPLFPLFSLSLLPRAVAYKYSAPLSSTRFIQIGRLLDQLVTSSTNIRLSIFSIDLSFPPPIEFIHEIQQTE